MTAVSPPCRVSQGDHESPSLGKTPTPTSATVGSWARRTGFRDRDSNGRDVEIDVSHTSKPADVSRLVVPGPISPAKSRTTTTTGDLDVSKSSSLRIESLRIFQGPLRCFVDVGWRWRSFGVVEALTHEVRAPGVSRPRSWDSLRYPTLLVHGWGTRFDSSRFGTCNGWHTGTPEDTAKVVSSMVMVSGLSTLLHTSFGSRLPLIPGASFVYLAPALAITFSPDFANLSKAT